MRQVDRQRHQLGVSSQAKPNIIPWSPAPAGSVHAQGDVGRLGMRRNDDLAGVGREAEFGVDVADVPDHLAHQLLDVDVRRGGDLAGHDDEVGRDQRLARDAAHRVVAQEGVEDAVADLVGDLVGVALGDRLGGEQELVGFVMRG